MKQLTLATGGFERNSKTTRRAAFLAEMERVVPWSALCELIEPVYPKPGSGRPPVPQVEPLLQKVNAQHSLYPDRSSARLVPRTSLPSTMSRSALPTLRQSYCGTR
jgi:hypothetical protein